MCDESEYRAMEDYSADVRHVIRTCADILRKHAESLRQGAAANPHRAAGLAASLLVMAEDLERRWP